MNNDDPSVLNTVEYAAGDCKRNPWPALGKKSGFDRQTEYWYRTDKAVVNKLTLEQFRFEVQAKLDPFGTLREAADAAAKGISDIAEAFNPMGSLSEGQIKAVTNLVNEKVEAAYAEGYKKGHDDGYNEGWNEGFDLGSGAEK